MLNFTELWQLPMPSTSAVASPCLLELPKRQIQLSLVFEHDSEVSEHDSGHQELNLKFLGVEIYKCNYFSSCDNEMVHAAYDKLVQIKDSSWLSSLAPVHEMHHVSQLELKHLMIYFDDGPCYEFICKDWSVERVGAAGK